MKYTAGPWFASPDPFDFNTYAIDIKSTKKTSFGDNISVATVFGSTVYGEEMEKANAQLMASAPEMLEALEILIKAIEPIHINSPKELKEARIKAINAVMKARGEA
jgi:hypothetical protein